MGSRSVPRLDAGKALWSGDDDDDAAPPSESSKSRPESSRRNSRSSQGLQSDRLPSPRQSLQSMPLPPNFTGHLWKEGASQMRWSRRYFLLTAESLAYYATADSQAPLHQPVRLAGARMRAPKARRRFEHVLRVDFASGEKMILAAEAAAELERWRAELSSRGVQSEESLFASAPSSRRSSFASPPSSRRESLLDDSYEPSVASSSSSPFVGAPSPRPAANDVPPVASASSPPTTPLSPPPAPPPADAAGRVMVAVRFREIRREETSGERYAVYELACREGGGPRSSSEVRWSDLARLHDELWHTHSKVMVAGKATGLIPPFYHHSLIRMGSSRFSHSFCQARADAMAALLRALVKAFHVSTVASAVHHHGASSTQRPVPPACLVAFLTRGADVEQPTPRDRWFSAADGWPPPVLAHCKPHCAPRSLTPTAGEAPALHPPPADLVGELFVEVLEATGLKRADALSQNDVYAIFVLDGHTVQTQTLQDMAHPRWQPHDGRACRLPVASAYSALHVALFDADFSEINLDDPLGKVDLPLCRLHPDTVYTAWLPLRCHEMEEVRAPGAHTALHALFSLWCGCAHAASHCRAACILCGVWYRSMAPTTARTARCACGTACAGTRIGGTSWRTWTRRRRACSASAPRPTPSSCALHAKAGPSTVPTRARHAASPGIERTECCCCCCCVVVVVRSRALSLSLSLADRPVAVRFVERAQVLDAHIAELATLQDALPAAKAWLLDLLLYKRPLLSLSAGVLWQLACWQMEFFVSLAPLGLLAVLVHGHGEWRAREEDIHRPPDVWEAFFLGGPPQGMRCEPSGARRGSQADVAPEQQPSSKEHTRESLEAAVQAELARRDRLRDAAQHSSDARRRKPPVRPSCGIMNTSQRLLSGAASGAIHAARAVVNLEVSEIQLNPMAVVLGPVQRTLGEHLVYLRVAKSIYRWEDPLLTGWCCVVLLGVSLLLLPVALLVLPRVPWAWLLRVCGLALLGPHMLCVGAAVRHAEKRRALLEDRWQEASEAEAAQMLEEHVGPLDAKAQAAEERERQRAELEEQKTPEGERERIEERARAVEGAAHTYELSARPSFEKHPVRVQCWRSKARPAWGRAGDWEVHQAPEERQLRSRPSPRSSRVQPLQAGSCHPLV